MAYKVLSLKWRPQSFKDIVGQEHITQTLINAFDQNRIAQGYIFTGPRGVGKTTTARILAMALNAEKGPSANFNPASEISLEIAEGRSLDVLEIDGASNRGIEEIRGIREQIKFAPIKGDYKVIIIDEVHMLTNQAFNALLRTLEEPPSHGKFIFATTDIHKVPATIISRCQRFDFNRLSIGVISDRLQYIINNENITIDPESIHIIAKKADGSMRDALSLLDQSISFCGNEIKYELLVKALGLIEQNLFFDFTSSLKNKNYSGMISLLSDFSEFGVPASEVLTGLLDHIRNLIYSGIDDGVKMLEMNKEHQERYAEEASGWDRRDLFRINQVLIDASAVIRRSEDPYLLLEMTLLKLCEMDQSIYIEQLLSNVNPDANNIPIEKKKPNLDEPDKNIPDQNNDGDKSSESTMNRKEDGSSSLNSEHQVSENKVEKDIEYIVREWPNILENINRIRPTVGSIVEDFIPTSFENNVIFLESTTSNSFNEKLMEMGTPIIEKEISERIDKNIKVRFENKHDKISKDDSSHQKNQEEVDSNDEKVFDRIVEVFDGEPIK
jgi:DNA polymerase-3 subunit gamma/tau